MDEEKGEGGSGEGSWDRTGERGRNVRNFVARVREGRELGRASGRRGLERARGSK